MTTAAHGNGYDPDKVKKYVDRIEGLDEDRVREHSSYMAACKVIIEDKKVVFESAKAEGIPTKALRTVIKTRAMERKLEALRDDLEGDDQDSFDQIRHALGDLADLPLGEAATAKAAKRKTEKKETNAALDAVAENTERLAAGIGQLHS